MLLEPMSITAYIGKDLLVDTHALST